jgi:hypothetical protein
MLHDGDLEPGNHRKIRLHESNVSAPVRMKLVLGRLEPNPFIHRDFAFLGAFLGFLSTINP